MKQATNIKDQMKNNNKTSLARDSVYNYKEYQKQVTKFFAVAEFLEEINTVFDQGFGIPKREWGVLKWINSKVLMISDAK